MPAFFALLRRIDEDLMQSAQESGCRHCGQRLHRADYPRKPRGCPPQAHMDCSTRLSLCCVECRKRTTPDSVRFLGRRVYMSIIVVLRGYGATDGDLLPPVSWATLKRWRLWWSETFPTTPAGRWISGLLPPAAQTASYPERMLASVQAETDADRLIQVLRLLLPPR